MTKNPNIAIIWDTDNVGEIYINKQKVPHLKVRVPLDYHYHLTCKDEFLMIIRKSEFESTVMFLANCMAVAQGGTSFLPPDSDL